MTAPVLALQGISKAFRSQGHWGSSTAPLAAVNDVTLSIAAAEIVGLVGMSGAGKSTLGRIMLGLERPDRGRVMFDGVDLARLPERALRPMRRRMHLIFQDPYASLHPGMRVAQIVAEPLVIAGIKGGDRAEHVATALAEVDLAPAARFERRFPHELSGGQRQRVALARALIGRPRFIVADEPTSMLDVSLRAGILDLIAGMRARYDIAFLFITHDLAVARYVSDRIGVMHQGRLIELGPAEEVIHRPRHEYTRALLAASGDAP